MLRKCQENTVRGAREVVDLGKGKGKEKENINRSNFLPFINCNTYFIVYITPLGSLSAPF